MTVLEFMSGADSYPALVGWSQRCCVVEEEERELDAIPPHLLCPCPGYGVDFKGSQPFAIYFPTRLPPLDIQVCSDLSIMKQSEDKELCLCPQFSPPPLLHENRSI